MWFSPSNEKEIKKKGMMNAVAAFAYVAAVGLFMSSLDGFDDAPQFQVVVPIAMLLLLVLSASVMGMLIFGAPITLYIDGKKREAMTLLGWTIGPFAVITVFMLLMLGLVSA